MGFLLGIDLGTSGLKAVVFDLDGRAIGKGFARNLYLPGPPGWAEQDPKSWWAGCCSSVRAALAEAGVDPAEIAGVGVCGFHHCPVFLDAEGEPARPTIVTHDTRLGNSLADLDRAGTLDVVVETSGSPVTAGHFPPIYHLVRTQDDPAIQRTRWIILAKDYLRYRLTGEVGTEICDATGTSLVSMPEQAWSETLCDLLRVPRDLLPEIGRADQVAGHVTEEAASLTGLEARTPVVYGGGDSHCALVGLGVVGSGEAGLLLGTNSTLRASFDKLLKPLHHSVWLQQHVVAGRYTVSASSMTGSTALDWLRETCLCGPAGERPLGHAELDAMAAEVPPGCDGLLFHPYLFGERSPFHNPRACGAFLGIRHWHGRGHLVRSVMEGVAFCIANCLDAINDVAQHTAETVSVIRTGRSGGSRLPVWRQIITGALDHPLQIVDVDEPGCLGAALLAGVGAGLYEDVNMAISAMVRVGSETAPDATSAALYAERREAFNDTYAALEPRLYR